MSVIAVTGATGNIGGRVARILAARDVALRLVVRDPSRAPVLPGAQTVPATYADGEAATAALAGTDTVLMVSAAEEHDRVSAHTTFVDAAARAGVQHLVYTSFVGASPTATFTLARDHWATEEHIRASGLRYTFLRDNLYADFLPQLMDDAGVIRGPAADGRAAVVAQDDIADVAVAVLLDPATHVGATYDLTGPESLSLAEIAATITAVTGRPSSYAPETLAEAYASRAHFAAPDWQVEAWVSTYLAFAAGELAAVSNAITELSGHPATTLAQLLAAQAKRA